MSGSPFGILEAVGADKASKRQTESADKATEMQYQMYQQSRQDVAPWRREGEEALNALSAMIEQGPGEFEASPGYQFTRDEGLNAMNQTMAGMGLRRSGAHAKAAGQYATDLASQEYDNFLRRYYNSLTPYQSMAQVGQTTGLQTGANALTTGQGMANTMLASGNAQAAGILGGVNAIGGSMGNAGQNIMDYTMYNNQKNALTQQQSSFNPSYAQGYGGGGAGSYYNMPAGGDFAWYSFM